MDKNLISKYGVVLGKNLSNLNRFGVGGKAEYFFEPKSRNELLSFLKENSVKPITMLGGGSNALILDNGIKGVVIATKRLNKFFFDKNNVLTCEAGLSNAKLYAITRDRGIGGYEFLGTIPGSVGGACITNAGCYGGEIKNNVLGVKISDWNGNTRRLDNEECKFSYRSSGFAERDIILEIYFKTDEARPKEEIEEIFRENMRKREASQPYYEKTCGSTFKNCGETPAWKIIQELGLQNVDFNGCKFSEKHANFLVNHGHCASRDLKGLIDLAMEKCAREKHINLELEVKILGE
ncbi:MAG: UDP-N-acetylmuramate dehydrogenase [Rickettsiales bacterium]|jgi:UDP-N-acetylmuramate dehydrogenase|nr:UDP-N-acetylmuramate dehydrogenase [Rickettsiales bacterium]